MAFLEGSESARQSYETERSREDAANKNYKECLSKSTVNEALECYRNADKATQEDYRAYSDLNAQWESAEWTKAGSILSALLGFLSLIAAIIGIMYVAFTLREARITTKAAIASNRHAAKSAAAAADSVAHAYEANKIARRNGFIDQRPWLDARIDQMAFSIRDQNLTGMINVIASNKGKTPAYDIVVGVELVNHWKPFNIVGATKILSDKCVNRQNGMGPTVLPSGECGRSAIVTCSLYDDQIDNFNISHIEIIVCVTYRLFGSDEIGQTGYVTSPHPITKDVSSFALYERFFWQIAAEESGPTRLGYAT